jgi:hypothetical protein
MRTVGQDWLIQAQREMNSGNGRSVDYNAKIFKLFLTSVLVIFVIFEVSKQTIHPNLLKQIKAPVPCGDFRLELPFFTKQLK